MTFDHKEIMRNAKSEAGKNFNLGFMKLPEDLQDEIINGLDSHEMTLLEAYQLTKAKGTPLGHEAIRRYYQVLCHQRKLYELDHIMGPVIQQYMKMDAKETLTAVLNVVSTHLINEIQLGRFGYKEGSKLLKGLTDLATSLGVSGESNGKKKDPKQVGDAHISEEAKKRVRMEVYGLPG